MGVEFVDAASTTKSGYRLLLRRNPDIVIIDLTFEGDDFGGLALIERIVTTNSNTPIIAFSMHDDPTIIYRTLTSGALSYVLKDAPSEELALAVRCALAGKPHLSHQLAMKVALLRTKRDPAHTGRLTEREGLILALLGRGNSYDTIAKKLGISYKTLINATALMRGKLKLSSVADLIRFANEQNDPSRLV